MSLPFYTVRAASFATLCKARFEANFEDLVTVPSQDFDYRWIGIYGCTTAEYHCSMRPEPNDLGTSVIGPVGPY